MTIFENLQICKFGKLINIFFSFFSLNNKNTKTTREVPATGNDPFMGVIKCQLRAPQSKNTYKKIYKATKRNRHSIKEE